MKQETKTARKRRPCVLAFCCGLANASLKPFYCCSKHATLIPSTLPLPQKKVVSIPKEVNTTCNARVFTFFFFGNRFTGSGVGLHAGDPPDGRGGKGELCTPRRVGCHQPRSGGGLKDPKSVSCRQEAAQLLPKAQSQHTLMQLQQGRSKAKGGLTIARTAVRRPRKSLPIIRKLRARNVFLVVSYRFKGNKSESVRHDFL